MNVKLAHLIASVNHQQQQNKQKTKKMSYILNMLFAIKIHKKRNKPNYMGAIVWHTRRKIPVMCCIVHSFYFSAPKKPPPTYYTHYIIHYYKQPFAYLYIYIYILI